MYRRRDFELVTVTTDKVNKKEKALEILKENEVSSQNYIFTGKDIYELIEVVDPNWQGSLPYTAVIAPGGKIVYNVEGAFEELELKRAIIKQIGRYYANDGDQPKASSSFCPFQLEFTSMGKKSFEHVGQE